MTIFEALKEWKCSKKGHDWRVIKASEDGPYLMTSFYECWKCRRIEMFLTPPDNVGNWICLSERDKNLYLKKGMVYQKVFKDEMPNMQWSEVLPSVRRR